MGGKRAGGAWHVKRRPVMMLLLLLPMRERDRDQKVASSTAPNQHCITHHPPLAHHSHPRALHRNALRYLIHDMILSFPVYLTLKTDL